MAWNEKVLNLMDERKINQKQLSQLSGINESSISRYLHSGQRPRMDVVVNIAKALQVETEYLLDEGETTESAYCIAGWKGWKCIEKAVYMTK